MSSISTAKWQRKTWISLGVVGGVLVAGTHAFPLPPVGRIGMGCLAGVALLGMFQEWRAVPSLLIAVGVALGLRDLSFPVRVALGMLIGPLLLLLNSWRSKLWSVVEPEDPSLSPYPWVSDAVWRQRKQVARFPSMGSPDPNDDEYDDDASLDAYVQTPSAEALASAPVAPFSPTLPIPPEGTEAEQQRRVHDLRELRGLASLNPVQWPLCCSRLTALELANPTFAELSVWESRHCSIDGTDLGGAPAVADIRRGANPAAIVIVFQCRSCGRVYGFLSVT
jgi:hypothetical protein